MYALASRLINLPVISLQTGETVAHIATVVIDPGQLQLVALRLDNRGSQRNLLVTSSIRQLALDCVVVDSDEELSEQSDLVRLIPLLDSGYTPLGKAVVTDLGRRLGKVEDFTINLETLQLQKIYVKLPLYQAWFRSSLIIDRAQIVDVQKDRFIVRDTTEFSGSLATKPSEAKPS